MSKPGKTPKNKHAVVGASGKGDKEQVARRRTVAVLSEQGMSTPQIAEALGRANFAACSISAVHKDLRAIDEQYKAEFPEERAQAKRWALAGLKRLIQTSMDGFRRSQQDELVVTEKHYVDQDGKPQVERTERRRGQAGDARFIGEARQAFGQIADLLGLRELKISGELQLSEKDYDASSAQLIERLMEDLAKPHLTIDGDVIEQHVDSWQAEIEGSEGNGKPKLEHGGE